MTDYNPTAFIVSTMIATPEQRASFDRFCEDTPFFASRGTTAERVPAHERFIDITKDDLEGILAAIFTLADGLVTPSHSDKTMLAGSAQGIVQEIAAAHDIDGGL